MKIEELYSLFNISISYGKRKLTIDINNFSASYFYNDYEKNWKPITFERLCDFIDKYRGKKENGYNRPSITTKTLETKCLESEGKMEYKEICKTVIEHYGIEKQKEKLIEECAELIVALAKKDGMNIAEEIADVTFLIDQIRGEDTELNEMIIDYQMYKSKRQIERIKKEQ